jgi:DNA-binding response OmpR family regulator
MQPLHVVVLEDDAAVRQQMWIPALRMHGFAVQGAASIAELHRLTLTRSFDIAVISIAADGGEAMTAVQQLRARSDIGIVVLTKYADCEQHAYALRAGADICLVKPVDMDVLSATLQSLARRLTQRASGNLIHDRAVTARDWRLETSGWRLISPHGKAVLLTSAEQCVVTLLAQEKGQPVPREALIRALSRRAEDFDPHRLEMMVHRLRRKVLTKTGERLPLLAARGVGYVLSCETDA